MPGLHLAALLVTAVIAHGASIGVNFTGGGNGGSLAISLLPTDLAGVIPQGNYNNVPGGSATNFALNNNLGLTTTALLTFTAGGTYSSVNATVTPAGGDEKLNAGFVFGSGSFTISNIPFTLYSLYVYELNDAGGRVETTTLGGVSFFGASATPNDAGHIDQNAATPYSYVQSISTNVASPTVGGDYVLYSNLTGSSQTFTSAAPGNGYVNGFQIVEAVPEPGSALYGAGLLCLAGLRRARRSSR